MMRDCLVILFLCVTAVLGQDRWTSRARVRDHTIFFTEVMQETIYELERIGFSTLRMVNVTQNIDIPMYKWHINGTAVYTNGFVISIQKIDVTGMSQSVTNPTINGVVTPRATVTGRLNLRDIKLGYDVIFTPVDGPAHWYTGDFTHILIDWGINIIKDLTTKEITVSMSFGTSGGLMRMVYRPTSNVTEVMSREFRPFNNAEGIATWSTVFTPIILDVIKNKIEFPEVCFSNC